RRSEAARPCVVRCRAGRARALRAGPRPRDAGTVTIRPEPVCPDTPPPSGVPVRLGRFEVRRFLGEGSYGRVYEAFDPTLQRLVALKVARPQQMLDEPRADPGPPAAPGRGRPFPP